MSDHSFNPFIAKKYGVIESILINTFVFWTKTNSAKDKIEDRNFHQERYWCFGTPLYFTKFFMYLTEHQIKYAIASLKKDGALLKGNFNKKGYDKTNWYSLSDQVLLELNLDRTCLQPAPVLIGQICTMEIDDQAENDTDIATTRASTHRTNLHDASDKFTQPIPVTKPVTKQKKETTTTSNPSGGGNFSKSKQKMIELKCIDDLRDDEEFLENCEHHIKHNSTGTSPYQRTAMILKLLKNLLAEGEHFKSKGFVSAKAEKLRLEQEKEKQRIQAEYGEQKRLAMIESAKSKPRQEKRSSPRTYGEIMKNGFMHAQS